MLVGAGETEAKMGSAWDLGEEALAGMTALVEPVVDHEAPEVGVEKVRVAMAPVGLEMVAAADMVVGVDIAEAAALEEVEERKGVERQEREPAAEGTAGAERGEQKQETVAQEEGITEAVAMAEGEIGAVEVELVA